MGSFCFSNSVYFPGIYSIFKFVFVKQQLVQFMYRVTSHLAFNCARLKCVVQKGTFPVARSVSDLLSRGSAKSLMFHLPFSTLN